MDRLSLIFRSFETSSHDYFKPSLYFNNLGFAPDFSIFFSTTPATHKNEKTLQTSLQQQSIGIHHDVFCSINQGFLSILQIGGCNKSRFHFSVTTNANSGSLGLNNSVRTYGRNTDGRTFGDRISLICFDTNVTFLPFVCNRDWNPLQLASLSYMDMYIYVGHIVFFILSSILFKNCLNSTNPPCPILPHLTPSCPTFSPSLNLPCIPVSDLQVLETLSFPQSPLGSIPTPSPLSFSPSFHLLYSFYSFTTPPTLRSPHS